MTLTLSERTANIHIKGVYMVRANQDEFPSLSLAADLIPEGWMVVDDVIPVEEGCRMDDLKLGYFLEGKEREVPGEVMCRRAAVSFQDRRLGLVDAKSILRSRAEIPRRLLSSSSQILSLIFVGTVLYSPGIDLFVPRLYWEWGERPVKWHLKFQSLFESFGISWPDEDVIALNSA